MTTEEEVLGIIGTSFDASWFKDSYHFIKEMERIGFAKWDGRDWIMTKPFKLVGKERTLEWPNTSPMSLGMRLHNNFDAIWVLRLT